MDYTVSDTWPYYNTSETYNVTIREPEPEYHYEYHEPYTMSPYIYYRRPAYTNAWCTMGPDDI